MKTTYGEVSLFGPAGLETQGRCAFCVMGVCLDGRCIECGQGTLGSACQYVRMPASCAKWDEIDTDCEECVGLYSTLASNSNHTFLREQIVVSNSPNLTAQLLF
jgi:hypothetical protein